MPPSAGQEHLRGLGFVLQDPGAGRVQIIAQRRGKRRLQAPLRPHLVQRRREAAADAEAIVDLQVTRYAEALAFGARNEPLKRLRAHGEATRAELLAKARQQLASGQDPANVVEQMAHALTNRLLHAPTAAIRDALGSGNLDFLRSFDELLPPAQRDDDAADPAP